VAVANTNSSVSYNGNGVQTAFPTLFKFLAAIDLLVKSTTAGITTALVLGTDYNVAGAGAEEPGGTVTTTVAPAIGTVLTIERDTPIVQPVVLAQSGPLPVKSLTGELDRLTLIEQELVRRIAALEALASLASVTNFLGSVVQFDLTTDAGAVENSFPFDVACPNGSLALDGWCTIAIHINSPGDRFDTPPVIQWFPAAGNNISITYISGLQPGLSYRFRMFVLHP
jgi:hypothetical protein